MKRVVILGSTGSIGENALRVVSELSSHLRVVGLAANRNYERVLEQAQQLGVRHVAIADPEMAQRCRAEAPHGMAVSEGAPGLSHLAALPDADIVLCAVVGMAGLSPVLAAVTHGKDVALATKEVLVAAGHLVMQACRKHGVSLLPVDSEHSAIFQCLDGRGAGGSDKAGGRDGSDACTADGAGVARLVLTASGGPFAGRPEVDFDTVTVEEALNHPRWDMGRKVTVDSATLMNKGLELMEAHQLFGIPVDRIDVVVHPESIVHSMVEFVDGSLMAQMSVPDMRFAIQHALTYPVRMDGGLPKLDLAEIGALQFRAPEPERFPCLGLAREAARHGGSLPAVLNAANEIAVQRFCDGDIPFSGIWEIVGRVMAAHEVVKSPNLADVMTADRWAREKAGETVC